MMFKHQDESVPIQKKKKKRNIYEVNLDIFEKNIFAET